LEAVAAPSCAGSSRRRIALGFDEGFLAIHHAGSFYRELFDFFGELRWAEDLVLMSMEIFFKGSTVMDRPARRV